MGFLVPLKQFISNNSTKIIVGVAIAGVGSTAVLAADGHLKAQEKRYEVIKDNKKQTVINAVKARWTYYIPAVTSGTVTILSILALTRTIDKRFAALATAYSYSEKTLEALRKASKDVLDDKQMQQIEKKAAENQQVSTNPDKPVLLIGSGEVLCYDQYSGRYFSSNKEAIRSAINDINGELYAHDVAPLNMYYSLVGLEEVAGGDQLGWGVSVNPLEPKFSSHLSPDGKPCLSIGFNREPHPNWWSLY